MMYVNRVHIDWRPGCILLCDDVKVYVSTVWLIFNKLDNTTPGNLLVEVLSNVL